MELNTKYMEMETDSGSSGPENEEKEHDTLPANDNTVQGNELIHHSEQDNAKNEQHQRNTTELKLKSNITRVYDNTTEQETQIMEPSELPIMENEVEIGQENDNVCGQGTEDAGQMDAGINDQGNDAYDTCDDENNIYIKYPLRKPKKHRTKRKTNRSDSMSDEDHPMCPVCSFTSNSKTGLLNHMRSHQVATRFTCSLCDEVFKTNSELIEHKTTHDGENHTFLCNQCQVAFSDHLDHLLHMAGHSKDPPYRCKECLKLLNTKEGFKWHIQTHFNRLSMECEICGKRCQGEDHYRIHLKKHTHSRVIKCEECGKVCKSAMVLTYHMASHTGVKLFQCIYCGKGFKNNSARNIHTRIHTDERPFECERCYQTFRTGTDLKKHSTTHMTEKEFSCEYCKKKFFHKASMVMHTNNHTRVNLYSCLECEKQFATRGQLRTHVIYMHTKEKLHRCGVCDVEFKMLSHLNRHNASLRHKNKMYGAVRKLKELEKN